MAHRVAGARRPSRVREAEGAAGSLPERIRAAADLIRSAASGDLEIGIVLGSGLGGLADRIVAERVLEYPEIPGFGAPTVESHSGRLILGALGGRRVIAMQGRFHRYEGHSLEVVTFPIRVMRALGVEVLIVSNVTGGLNPDWSGGELVQITDHLNLTGDNPLIGPNHEELGPRFPDMSEPYDARLGRLASVVAEENGIRLSCGVYAGVAGPSLETPAEYRMLRMMGADLVGMSTVPEVIVAVHGGMRVLGLSIVTNVCRPESPSPASVSEILRVAREAEPKLTRLIEALVARV
jgi:purine-nucleoside phosphorylase